VAVVSPKNHSAKTGRKAFIHPVARFLQDFTRLIQDVDQLTVDIGNATEQERTPGRANGGAQKPMLNKTISTLRQCTRSISKSLGHLGLLLNEVPVPCLELDGKARILRTNAEGAEILNDSAARLLRKSLFSFVADSDIKRLREHFAVVRQTNKPCAINLSIVRNGQPRPVELHTRRQLVGSELGYVAVVETTDPLRDSHNSHGRHRKRETPSMHELVVTLSCAQTLKSMADSVANYCGKTFSGSTGMIFASVDGDLRLVSQWRSNKIPKNDLTEEMIKGGPVARAFRTGEPSFWRQDRARHSQVSRCLGRVLRRSRCQSVFFLPLSAPGQQPVGVLAILLPDVEELVPAMRDHLLRLGQIVAGCIARARAYDAALAARVKAEDASRTKDEFISIVSHELKNPMMPILGWAVALSSGTLPADKQNQALDVIVRNVRSLNHMIEDLFDAARISSGKLRLQPAEIRIQEVAREALTTVQQSAEAKKLRISTDISEAVPPFIADPYRLQQVLTNLLNNAVKFTPEGGSIYLRIRRRGGSMECIVSDTGKGIERKFLPFVFDRFRQENRPSKVRTGGLGLGLKIVWEIVALHDGSIKAFSAGRDKGSTFVLRLPIRRRHYSQRVA
jgi:signal transduction histidine kinase